MIVVKGTDAADTVSEPALPHLLLVGVGIEMIES